MFGVLWKNRERRKNIDYVENLEIVYEKKEKKTKSMERDVCAPMRLNTHRRPTHTPRIVHIKVHKNPFKNSNNITLIILARQDEEFAIYSKIMAISEEWSEFIPVFDFD